MTLINLKDLGVTLGVPLFSNLDLTINRGDRIGLVAANGRGKTTFLRCLSGQVDPSEGACTRARGLCIGHVEQNIPSEFIDLSLYETVLRALPAEQAEYETWRVDIVLDDLDIPTELHQRPIGELSGGWQRTALLARSWVTEPDLLLMDEPTNHLDLTRIGFLQRWMGKLPRDVAIVISSHDRAFLDETTNRTLFLRSERSQDFALPYSPAREALHEADAAIARRFENDMKQAKQLRRQAAKLKNIGINSGSDLLVVKTKQLTDRADRMEDAAQSAHQERSAGAIRLANRGTHARALVTLDDAQISIPGGRPLFRTGKFWICPGDRVVLMGQNGTGKSLMIRMIQEAIAGEAASSIRIAPSVVPGYCDQDLSHLAGDENPLAAICNRFDVGDQRARTLLAGAGVNVDLQTKPVETLSGGQKARLAMLILRLTHPNFYLLDEPTNHLDIEGQEALEDELEMHETSCLLVSHDRNFVRAVGNRFWVIEGGKLLETDSPEAFFAKAIGAS